MYFTGKIVPNVNSLGFEHYKAPSILHKVYALLSNYKTFDLYEFSRNVLALSQLFINLYFIAII